MIVYVGGDGHSAAAQTASPYTKADDDLALVYMGPVPHPANLAVSWAQRWITAARAGLHIEAQAGLNNEQILQRAQQWLTTNARYHPIVIMGWTNFGDQATQHHELIWQLHCYLLENQCPHLFFNTTEAFAQHQVSSARDWGIHYIGPYDSTATYLQQVEAAGYQTLSPDTPYYGPDAHAFWFRHLLTYTVTHNLV